MITKKPIEFKPSTKYLVRFPYGKNLKKGIAETDENGKFFQVKFKGQWIIPMWITPIEAI